MMPEDAKEDNDGLVLGEVQHSPGVILRVYRADPTPVESSDIEEHNNHFLRPPVNEKNFLISPPGSPPVGWEPIREDPPNVTPLAHDLIAAYASLNFKPSAPAEVRVWRSYLHRRKALVSALRFVVVISSRYLSTYIKHLPSAYFLSVIRYSHDIGLSREFLVLTAHLCLLAHLYEQSSSLVYDFTCPVARHKVRLLLNFIGCPHYKPPVYRFVTRTCPQLRASPTGVLVNH
ncbi:hypothetical protein A0H81_04860 [Grifola frondosa]|uniref:Uncharacterized protein n=1 Tax=Grifola frondosa TaxID=5627 RepID=A0A1C7MF81_GRIFR|nr:hypothetical protein A0H81_04860 [Grifola frondosa]